MKLTKLEMETIIIFNEEESTAEVYTQNVKLRNRFEKFQAKFPDLVTKRGDTFILPKNLLRIMPVSPTSEENIERARKLGEKNKNNLKHSSK